MSMQDILVFCIIVIPIAIGLSAFAAIFGYIAGREVGLDWFGESVVVMGDDDDAST